MPTTTVRVSKQTRDTLYELSKTEGISMQDILERVLESYRRQKLLEAANAAYARLRANPEASRAFDEELTAWDGVLADGLEHD